MHTGTTWRCSLLVFGLLVLASGILSSPVQAQSTNTTEIWHVGDLGSPIIDAIRDDVYEDSGSEELQMLEVRAGPSPMPEENLSGSCWAVHDDEFLYVFVDVTDDFLLVDEDRPIGDHWNDDSVELYIDGDDSKCSSCYDGVNDAQLRFRIGDDVPSGGDGSVGGSTGTSPASLFEGIEWITLAREDEMGYAIEVKIPLAPYGIQPVDGYQIGFDCHVNDRDQPGGRNGKLHWGNAPGDNQYQHAHQFPTVTLRGGQPAESATARLTMTPTGSVRLGTEFTFDGSASAGMAGAEIVSYEWDFGDGNGASGAVVTHTYEAKGTYTVTLSVTDSEGSQDETSTTVRVLKLEGMPDHPLEIPFTDTAPEINAVLDDAYDVAQVIVLEHRANDSLPDDEDDLSVTAYLMWDADHLYVFYDVTDEAIFTDHADSWRNDTAELYIDGDNSKNVREDAQDNSYDENDMQLEFVFGSSAPTGTGPYTGVEFATAEKSDGTGYYVEVSVPWSTISVDPEDGKDIGLELMVNDRDAPGDQRETKIAWFAEGIDEAWRDPSVWGNAVLVLELTTSIDDPSELPGRFAIESVYPNPFNPSTNALLNVQEPGDYTVRVFNVLGQLVHEQQLKVQAVGQTTVSLDLGDRASGVYLLSVQHDASGKSVTAKALLVK